MSDTTFETMLEWHLTHNHYPSVPAIMFDVCREAIDLARTDDWEADIELPEGFLFLGRRTMKVWQIVEVFHLESFSVSSLDV